MNLKSIDAIQFLSFSFLLIQQFSESSRWIIKTKQCRTWGKKENILETFTNTKMVWQENTNLSISLFYFCFYRGKSPFSYLCLKCESQKNKTRKLDSKNKLLFFLFFFNHIIVFLNVHRWKKMVTDVIQCVCKDNKATWGIQQLIEQFLFFFYHLNNLNLTWNPNFV